MAMLDLSRPIASLHGPIIVTGASGFVGANLFKRLLRERQDVFAIVLSEKNWRLDEIDDDHVIAADLNDFMAVKNLVETIRPKTVFDCVAYGAYSFEQDSELIYQTNFLSIVKLIELLRSERIFAFVHAGSSSEYGDNSAAPEEEAPYKPNSHYAVSKLGMSHFLRYMGKHCDFPGASLRLYSVYGPLEDTSRLIPTLLRAAKDRTLPPLVDPRISRDFVHVDDVCAAFIQTAVKMEPRIYGESFNIGTGTKTTIRMLADTTRRLFAIEEAPRFGTMDNRSWDVADWYANPSKAEAWLGWRATISLEEGLVSTMRWVASLTDPQLAAATKKHRDREKRSITAVIACYKDELAIPVMHQRLTQTFRRMGIDYEIIFVNDGSPDGSMDAIREITQADAHVIGVCHSRNFGSQMAFRSGMELSTKQAVVLLDGDLQDPPELIEQFVAEWKAGNDVVYGRRIKREMPWAWGILYKLFYRIFAAFSYVRIPHDAGDFSLIDRRAVGWLLKCPERDLFMRGLRAYVGFRQTGVDYVRPERMFGRSTNNLVKNIEWAKKGIFSFSNVPLTILTSAGLLLLVLSALAGAVVVALRYFIPDIAPRGVTTLLVSTLFFGSLNLFAIGVVGEYVAKIMTEVKGRPRFIRSALIRHGKTTALLPEGKTA